jgi:hypothetical protein
MSLPLIIGLSLLLLALLVMWAIARTRRIRAAERQREEEALARLRTGESSSSGEGETVFEAAGLPSRMPARQGIEVAEHDEVVDLEALLAGEPQGVAHRARATLEEPTNISLDLDTIPPRPPVAAPAPPAAAPSAAAAPLRAAVAPSAAAHAVPPVQPAPAASQPALAAAGAAAARPAPARPAQPSPPTLVARLPTEAERAATAALSGGAAIAARLPQHAAQAPAPGPLPGGGASVRRGAEDVPLRELALAWFEARGYRSSPASAAVRPIEQVLRHRHDPARAYAFVVENAKVSAERVQQLRTQARSIGLLRVLIVANEGAEEGAAAKSKGVRLMDRSSIAAEFDQLDFSVAAKIIAVARKRSAVPTTVH